MNNMEIQKEAIIEIVGTQYEGRALNHQALFFNQELFLKHQNDNPYDHNAVLLLTKDGKELGFLPKGYASLYAPAIDSGRYKFSVEVVKTEPDPQRPILIVKVVSELASHSEKEIESDIIAFAQNIVNGYALGTREYIAFIYAETVNVDELLSVLDKVRLMQKLLSCSYDLIERCEIKPNSDRYTPLTKDSLTNYLSELKADISDVLKQIQKAYNESLDIDDEEEYHRVQSEIRERRKSFRQYYDLLTSLLEAVTSYSKITSQSNSLVLTVRDGESEKQIPETENSSTVSESDAAEIFPTAITKPEPEITTLNNSQLTEQAFFEWLVSEGSVSESTAEQYISNIHSIEKLYQTLFGVRNNLLGTNTDDNGKAMIESLIVRNEYIDANERRHNSFGASLAKFARFADISVEGLNQSMEKKSYQPPVKSAPFVVKTVDFDNPHNCTYYKPRSFILNKLKYDVGNWRELYTKFLILLYNDNTYSEIIKRLVGKSLYGRRIDFADKRFLSYLRAPITISSDFFAEGNLSAVEIIKRIKYLMDLCSIDVNSMTIEYNSQDNKKESVEPTDTSADGYEKLSVPDVSKEAVSATIASNTPEKAATSNTIEQSEFKLPVVDKKSEVQAEVNTKEISNVKDRLIVSAFAPDTTKPFVLKDAVIKIISSDAPEITKRREYKNGISSKSLREMLKEYYGKTIGLFEISKLLMTDRTFKSLGKGCYILNEAMMPKKIEVEEIEPVVTEVKREVPMKTPTEQVYDKEPLNTDYNAVSYTEQVADTTQKAPEKVLTIESILEVIKEKSGNLQYDDGFGAYEVKTLLSGKGFGNVSEEQIEDLMAECSDLQQIEEGYYSLTYDKSYDDSASESIVVVEDTPDSADMDTTQDMEIQEVNRSDNNNQIVLRLNGNIVRAFDYSDALSKVCEFTINCKPFKMARIAGQGIILNGNNVFYRKAVPVEGYNKLSNGLQLAPINTVSDLQTITNFIKTYCQIDDSMIAIISQ